MRARTPRWWYRQDAGARLGSWLLAPLGAVWAAVTARRIDRTAPYDPEIPVICVGNLTLGGSGKTPVVMEIARWLIEAGRRPAILASGYGGRLRGPLRVDPDYTADEVGDEPLLLARIAPTFISRERPAGARAIAEAGFDVIVMDDGHQNPSLRKALSVVVVDAETRGGEWPFGAGGVVPAGPLREPLKAGLSRAQLVVALRPMGVSRLDPELAAALAGPRLWTGTWGAQTPPPMGPLFAFAGIAKPWRFFQALKQAGGELAGTEAFPDHAVFTESDLARLTARARSAGARLVTTEKDATRLPPAWRDRVTAWAVSVRIDNESAVREPLIESLHALSVGLAGRS